MSNIAIEFENISKQYRLGTIGTGTISHDLNRWWHLVRGKEDPYLMVGEVNDRSTKATSDYVWALRDINFKVEQGEVLGIIGKNGAGKSTLLKILSRITSPSTGVIRAKGRIASLLEVGTGFHGEMTGRENIYMNGAIMGMTRHEITRKLDEIIEFSGIEKYIDTPVKRYSSGMTVRLGFAVAAHLEPEILVVDEVLAVGDAEFQKKAIGKMKDVSQGGGRTVLFVSHNMNAVKNLCRNGVILKNGTVDFVGEINEVIESYLLDQSVRSSLKLDEIDRKGDGLLRITDVRFYDINGEPKQSFLMGSSIKIIIEYDAKNTFFEQPFSKIDVGINNIMGDRVAWLSTSIYYDKITNKHQVVFLIEELLLVQGTYNINIYVDTSLGVSDWLQNILSFELLGADIYNTGRGIPDKQGFLVTKFIMQ